MQGVGSSVGRLGLGLDPRPKALAKQPDEAEALTIDIGGAAGVPELLEHYNVHVDALAQILLLFRKRRAGLRGRLRARFCRSRVRVN